MSRKSKYHSSREVLSERRRIEPAPEPKLDRPSDTRGTIRRIGAILFSHPAAMIIVIISCVASALLSVLGPMYLGDIIDAIQVQVEIKLADGAMDFGQVLKILMTVFLVYAASSVMMFIQNYLMAGMSQDIARDLRGKINRKLSRLPLRFFDSNSKGDILSRLTNDMDSISVTLQNNLVQLLTAVSTLVGVFVMMMIVSPLMGAITLATIPPCVFVTFVIARRSERYFRRQWNVLGELNGHIEEMYTGHKVIKAFDREHAAIEEFDEINTELFRVSRLAQFLSGNIGPLMTFINNLGYSVICIVGGLMFLQGSMTLGVITSFIAYSKMFTQPISNIGNLMNNLQASIAAAERVFHVLDEEDAPPDSKENRIVKQRGNGRVCFEHVDFGYKKDRTIIHDLNLTVEPGNLVAIVGPTGAGKTTLVNLLMRFYDVDQGRITIDGVDIRTVPRENLRSVFGMVLQDAWLFEGTVRENIAYGRFDATEEEILRAAHVARVDEIVDMLPNGYDTLIEENGANLSQGERQLITIARAVLSDPEILILDEATSSVDTRTELLIQESMQELMHSRTSFVIAHRLSTIREADAILVMRHGKIVESGSHEELLEKGGTYAQLYNSQFGDCDIDEDF
ncbi:MAG TPA: ABC transporter ATP-binding protein [Candidatus Onthovicinus excrementipullorum]|nr:ABC transporter ATP-binding protein [Candidatus Onthovicinus excrementipullorum]